MHDILKIDFSQVFENMTAGLCVVEIVNNRDGGFINPVIVEINSKFETMFKLVKNDVIGSSIRAVCGDMESKCLQALKNVYRTGNDEKLSVYRADINKYLVVKFFKPEDKYVVILVTDVTEQKLAEIKLIESERSFRTLYENVAGGVLIVDEDYIIRDVNERTCEITGFKKEELVGELCDIICPKGFSSNKCPVWAGKQPGFVGMDTSVKCKNNTFVPIIKDAKRLTIGGKQCIFENFHDITDQKMAEKELTEARDKAEESNRLKSAFLANVSHEIRTPMNGILGFADLLMEPELHSDIQQKYIQVIERSGKRMLDIINDLIDISKIEAGQFDFFYEEININKILKEQCSFFKLEAENKNLGFVCNLLESDNLCVYSDNVRLNQILCNLLNNAIKYTKEGTVEFGARTNNHYCEFYVRDTGVGIVKELQDKIFDRFRQGDLEMTRKYQGVGLGLSISKAYVEKMGGKIWLDSYPGKGSVFYFTMPLSNEFGMS